MADSGLSGWQCRSAKPERDGIAVVRGPLEASLDADRKIEMAQVARVVTAKLPNDLVAKMDEVADRTDRSKSWIIRQAVSEWLAEEQRRHELTLEALKSVDEGRTIPHAEVLAGIEQRKRERRKARP